MILQEKLMKLDLTKTKQRQKDLGSHLRTDVVVISVVRNRKLRGRFSRTSYFSETFNYILLVSSSNLGALSYRKRNRFHHDIKGEGIYPLSF